MHGLDELNMEIFASIVLLRQVAASHQDTSLDIECENLHRFYEREISTGWTSELADTLRIDILNLHLSVIHGGYADLVPICANLYTLSARVGDEVCLCTHDYEEENIHG